MGGANGKCKVWDTAATLMWGWEPLGGIYPKNNGVKP